MTGDYTNADNIYEDITNDAILKKAMTNYLHDYNHTTGVVAMDLVLFHDAMEHGKDFFFAQEK